ncbi:MAG: GTP cyclohydrolase II [Candidatus Saccharibacteria bacterium]|nr:GTP cyclohydrolase II [Moraxellaceae bacterium]
MSVMFIAVSKLPTKHGLFDISVFEDPETEQEHIALSIGIPISNQTQTINPAIDQEDPILVRIHSECLTGDAFGSLRCDCGPQLNSTLELLAKQGRGALLYLRQEGRGIGLPNKIRAYALQDQGHDTLDANLMLGLPADARTYEMCKVMLDHLGIQKVNLITNNPAKIEALVALGLDVVKRTALYVGENPHNAAYLETKKNRMRHIRG